MINTKQIYCTKCQEITPQVDCTCNFMCAICGHKNDLRNSLPPNCNARIIEEIKELEALRDKLVQEKKETAPTEEEMLEWVEKQEVFESVSKKQLAILENNTRNWISIYDSLPDMSGRYWCYVEEINDLGKSYYQWNYNFDWHAQRFNTENGDVVTHWMPLPEPPKAI